MLFVGLLLQTAAEAEPAVSPAYEALILAAVGVTVVFGALVFIGSFIYLLGKVFAEREVPVARDFDGGRLVVPTLWSLGPCALMRSTRIR